MNDENEQLQNHKISSYVYLIIYPSPLKSIFLIVTMPFSYFIYLFIIIVEEKLSIST